MSRALAGVYVEHDIPYSSYKADLINRNKGEFGQTEIISEDVFYNEIPKEVRLRRLLEKKNV